MSEIQIYNLFPVPVMRVKGFLSDAQIEPVVRQIGEGASVTNARSGQLSHTEVVDPQSDPAYAVLAAQAADCLRNFGFLLFGENLEWAIKDMWANVLATDGHQSLHAHANSFISGVIYLTDIDASAHTVFHNSMGGRQFVFSNHHEGAAVTPYNGEQWMASECERGDMILFPSYLLHAVPRNEGQRRVSIAFNALPQRLKSWDYAIEFASSRDQSSS